MDLVFEDIGVYQEVMDNFFQPEFDAKEALRATSSSPEKCLPTIDEFESQLVKDNPELAKVICELDSVGNKGKKTLIEVLRTSQWGRRYPKFHHKAILYGIYICFILGCSTVLQNMKSDWSSGPMSLLYRAIREKLRLELIA
uniref:DDE_Tnp_1_7 domain-containing protein n=1 Tax=Heterorhabditis bacteriophora TaxID=37862 RepID=A0A1I7XDL9_HETBA